MKREKMKKNSINADATELVKPEEKKRLTQGGRNLVLLGVIAVLIALGTTSVSLIIYHNTGDIYLDRSRPGFLPDETEVEKDEESQKGEGDYEFEKGGKLTAEVLNEYLEKLDIEVKAVDTYDGAFGKSALSDERLGIPKAETGEFTATQ